MKKIFCLLLSIILTVIFLAPSAVAWESDNAEHETFQNAVNFTCIYQAKEKRVYIDGTVAHDFLVNHEDYKITVYRILPGLTLENIMADEESTFVAQSDMTVKFTFYVDVENVLEQFSKYAIVLVSSSGESHLAGQPLIPSVSSEVEYDLSNKSAFKGILSDSSLNVGDSGAGTVIVDVDISKTRGDSANSILYPMGNTYVHFSKSYISLVDKQLMSALVNNARVYIRLLLPVAEQSIGSTSSEGYLYSIPNLYSEDIIEYIYTLSAFLSERYDGNMGKLYGIIAGSKIDDVKNTNFIGEYDIDGYAELYTLYLTVIANAVRATDNTLDIVIPLSDTNDYNKEITDESIVQPSTITEQIVYRLDKNVSGNFDCTLLVESDTSPISAEENGGNVVFVPTDEKDRITPATIDVLLTYIHNMSQRYKSAPSNVIYLWNIDLSLGGNKLACAYTYAYIRLLTKDTVSSFAININTSSYNELAAIIRRIDTDTSLQSVQPLCKYFGAATWEEILQSTPTMPVLNKIFEVNITTDAPADSIGEFQYMDFTSSTVYPLMHEGHNCEYVRTDYNSQGNRILRVGSGKVKIGDSVELVGAFEYSESYMYTPILSLTMGVEDLDASASALYEISITVGTGDTRLVALGILKNGETKSLYFDVEDFAEIEDADYIRISARCLTEDSMGISLLLEDIKGYSTEHNSQRLAELIEERRLQIRNQGLNDGSGFNYTTVVTVLGVCVAAAVLALALLIPLKRDDDSHRS